MRPNFILFFVVAICLVLLTGCSDISENIDRLPESIGSFKMFFMIVLVASITAIIVDFLLNIFINSNVLISTAVVVGIIIWKKDYGFLSVSGIAILTLVTQLLIGFVLRILFALAITWIGRIFRKE